MRERDLYDQQNYAQSSNGMMKGLLFGAVVGAGIALLMAPAAGTDTLRRLKDKAKQLRGKAEDLADDTREKLENAGHAVGAGARDLANTAKENRDSFQSTTGGTTSYPKRP
ncbi:MAG: YtxH domain-containing protein [Candidatus Eisenbacteria bacterium]